MAAIGNIVLNDALATPVAHTFAPRRVGDLKGQGVLAEWEDRSSTYYIGYNRVVMQMSLPQPSGRDTIRVRIRVMTPKMETVSNSTVSGIAPAPTVAYTPMFDGTFVLPARSALQDRKDLRKFVQFLLADTAFVNLLENFDAPY